MVKFKYGKDGWFKGVEEGILIGSGLLIDQPCECEVDLRWKKQPK